MSIGNLFGVGAIALIVALVLWAVEAMEPSDARARRLAAEAETPSASAPADAALILPR
jgi:hypothetical protein